MVTMVVIVILDITIDARQTTGDRREYKNQHTPALARIVTDMGLKSIRRFGAWCSFQVLCKDSRCWRFFWILSLLEDLGLGDKPSRQLRRGLFALLAITTYKVRMWTVMMRLTIATTMQSGTLKLGIQTTNSSTSERPLPDAWLDNGEMVLN